MNLNIIIIKLKFKISKMIGANPDEEAYEAYSQVKKGKLKYAIYHMEGGQPPVIFYI